MACAMFATAKSLFSLKSYFARKITVCEIAITDLVIWNSDAPSSDNYWMMK